MNLRLGRRLRAAARVAAARQFRSKILPETTADGKSREHHFFAQ
jgi:hypothetical protein